MNILVVNAGSSSLKYQLINTETDTVAAKGICERIGIKHYLATEFDPKTGKAIGLNCKDGEKIVRMKKDAAEYTIRDVYTDNLKSDGPLLTLATRNKFHVVKGKVNKIN